MLIEPDSSGGLGSFPRDLWETITGGLKAVAAGEISKRYGYGSFSDLPTINANGQVKPAAAPSPGVSVGDQLGQALRNPFVMLAGGALLVLVVVKLVKG
jgi:hypothetical protein